MGFKRISHGLFTFVDFADIRLSIDQKSQVPIEYQLNQIACNSFFFFLIYFYPELEFFVLGFNVDHSKLIRLSFCHVLSWFTNITNSKPNIRKIMITSHEF